MRAQSACASENGSWDEQRESKRRPSQREAKPLSFRVV